MKLQAKKDFESIQNLENKLMAKDRKSLLIVEKLSNLNQEIKNLTFNLDEKEKMK